MAPCVGYGSHNLHLHVTVAGGGAQSPLDPPGHWLAGGASLAAARGLIGSVVRPRRVPRGERCDFSRFVRTSRGIEVVRDPREQQQRERLRY